MLKPIDKMQIIIALNDMDINKITGDELLEKVKNYEEEMQSAKAILKGHALDAAIERYKSLFGSDEALREIQALRWI